MKVVLGRVVYRTLVRGWASIVLRRRMIVSLGPDRTVNGGFLGINRTATAGVIEHHV